MSCNVHTATSCLDAPTAPFVDLDSATNTNSVLLWRGPSELDPEVEIGAFLTYKSGNKKTTAAGENMTAVAIMRLDMTPTAVAGNLILQKANCGDCKLIGDIFSDIARRCYVTLFHGPRSTWESWAKGNVASCDVAHASETLRGERLRLGSWGDPASVPARVWHRLKRFTRFTLSYTHQWPTRPDLASFCMASVDSLEERARAIALGFRPFRTMIPGVDTGVVAGEILCPASAEGGRKSHCAVCGLCDGNKTTSTFVDKRKSIAIWLHDPKSEAIKNRLPELFPNSQKLTRLRKKMIALQAI